MEDIQFNKSQTNIIGAGGLAREVASWLKNDPKNNYNILGFWDDNLEALNNYQIDLSVLGKISEFKKGNIHFGIMNTETKEKLFQEFIHNPEINICQFVHSSVLIGDRTSLGKGVILFPNVIVSCDIKIGDGSFVNLGSQIGHDVTIGNYVSIMPNVDLGGGCIIEDNVFIGTGTTVLPGVRIAKNTRIGAGSVVLRSIKKAGTYFGNPAKKIF
ncbi:acetyltransferase [Sphingobacterium mizutaii]|uniref:acetyltransferase n=1 Tax=Sphingobacterium mizutaii TaxID=1010 RepID=UPI0028A2B3E2|nr:acetyltransferase [Sphingobacterium mizutaii]